ncbi:MAG: hypothetical protein ACXWUD_14085 [Methylosarcina sp.]
MEIYINGEFSLAEPLKKQYNALIQKPQGIDKKSIKRSALAGANL